MRIEEQVVKVSKDKTLTPKEKNRQLLLLRRQLRKENAVKNKRVIKTGCRKFRKQS